MQRDLWVEWREESDDKGMCTVELYADVLCPRYETTLLLFRHTAMTVSTRSFCMYRSVTQCS